MRLTQTFDRLIEKLKSKSEYFDEKGELLKSKVIYEAQNDSESILEILLSDEKLCDTYFKTINNVKIFLKDKFINTVNHKEFFPSSYTSYLNYIGLSDGVDYIKKSKDVVLNFPYKDCVLEGGQSKEEQSLKEFFYNETLANDEIDRLLHPKVFTNIKKYTKDGVVENPTFRHTDNLLIKGNNLIALHSIAKRYEGRVKLIYIDPPYNTENDSFTYNDKFNHSSWLVFMKNRLEIAKKLLTSDGVIFVSLDDKEAHYCKVLMDEIFGRENFIADICHKSRASVSNDKIISSNHNHILLFAKNEREVFKKRKQFGIKPTLDGFKEEDERGKYKLVPVDGPGGASKGNPYYEFLGITDYWRFSKDTMTKMYNDGLIVKKENSLQQKYYLEKAKNSQKTITTWWDEGFLTSSATTHLKKFMGDNIFTNPKNINLIKRIIELWTIDGDIVLDFFSGSATTAHSLIELNNEDDKKRQFITIEQMDYIETVTKRRIQKVQSVYNFEFLYMELMTNNQTYIDMIIECESSSQLIEIKNELKESFFIRYEVKDENLFDENNEFDTLPLQTQKEILLKILDKNQLYVNYSEIDDTKYDIDDEVKRFNREFYEVK